MTPSAASREQGLEPLQVLHQKSGSSGRPTHAPAAPDTAGAVAVVPVQVPVDSANDQRLTAVANGTDALVTARAPGRVDDTVGLRPPSARDEGARLPASGCRHVTGSVVSSEENLEALQALCRKLRGPGPMDLLFAVPDSADVLVAAPAHVRLHSTTTLCRATFRDTAIRRSEPLEAAP